MASDEYRVVIGVEANKILKKLTGPERKKVLKASERMVAHPTAGAKPLRHLNWGVPVWTKPLGDLRIIFTVDTRLKEVVIRDVRRRKEDTYEDL